MERRRSSKVDTVPPSGIANHARADAGSLGTFVGDRVQFCNLGSLGNENLECI